MTDIDYSKILKTARKELNDLPTAKQINFAKEISEVLDIPLPEDKTKRAYKEFIDSNVGQYKATLDEFNDVCYWFEELGG